MFKIALNFVENLMQIMHNTLIFYVQLPVGYISNLNLNFLQHFVCLFFYHFLGFFQGKFWGFLHNRVATLVTIGEQKISPDSDFF